MLDIAEKGLRTLGQAHSSIAVHFTCKEPQRHGSKEGKERRPEHRPTS